MASKISSKVEAPAVIAAAASLATAAVASAASIAVSTLNEAALIASKVVSDAASKAILEFPRLQEDIRELRASQTSEAESLTRIVTTLLESHTKSEEVRLGNIDSTCARIDSHLVEYSHRLLRAESHITRHNLIIFGLIAPVCLIIIGAIVTVLFKDYVVKSIGAMLQ